MKCLCIVLLFIHLKSVMLDSNNQDDENNIQPLSSAVLYKAVNYLSKQTYEKEVKVNFLSIPYNVYYTHIYMAFQSADRQLSTVSLNGSTFDSEVNGVNLVLPLNKLDDMYAPYPISSVLDFVRGCYQWVADKHWNNSYISIMRYSHSENINFELIESTSKQFFNHAKPGSYHFIWERQSKSVSIRNAVKCNFH
ncbi:unnamed protein product [Heterobilharzia americana]|nr:unnamed protein product [Heterobilharzia americana]CAH8460874.1 unnamed protein product [Heterobilharzia americana]